MDIGSIISSFSYFGFFLIGFFSTLGLFISPPLYLSLPIIIQKGGFNPFFAIILTALGMSVGDTIGYFIGFSSEKIVEDKINKKKKYQKFSNLLNKYGPIIISIFAAMPFPFYDALAIACGFAKVNIKTYFIYLFIGRLVKVSLVVAGGYYLITSLSL